MIEFTIFRIPVRIEPYFWITMALIGGALGANSREALFALILFMLAGLISILVHELGHALTGRAFGAWTAITLQAFGGYASFGGVKFSRVQDFLVTMAGPLAQIVLGGAAFVVAINLPEGTSPYGIHFVRALFGISLIWAILNLLPVLPLDGGRLLNAMLGPHRVHITLWVSLIVAVTAAVLGYVQLGSWLLPIFMGMFAWEAWKALQARSFR